MFLDHMLDPKELREQSEAIKANLEKRKKPEFIEFVDAFVKEDEN